jgi:DNA repair protein RecO (recombination protein O)
VSAPGASDRGYVLHSYPYRETSLIVEAWTEMHGRMALMARGARRPKSALRGVLGPFQPLTLSWFGKGEMKTLKTAEAERVCLPLGGASMMSAFYLNELLLKLTQREDPHEGLFAAYDEAVSDLRSVSVPRTGEPAADYAAATRHSAQSRHSGFDPLNRHSGLDTGHPPYRGAESSDHDLTGSRIKSATTNLELALRRFEKRLLKELGYQLLLANEADTGTPVAAGREYAYIVERGPVAAASGAAGGDAVKLDGATLLDLEHERFGDARSAAQAKQLMRHLINHFLNGQVLHTRQLVKELQQI